jgi:hypothetical protein
MGTIISGIIWIAIFSAIGIYGATLGGLLGTVVSYAGWFLAVLSIAYISKVIIFTLKGIKMMKEDPEKFNKLRDNYHNAVNRVNEEEKTSNK